MEDHDMIRSGRILIILFCTVVTTAFGNSVFASGRDPIESANDDYTSGKFEEAKVKYLQIVQDHRYTPELFYNLGNAWFKLGDYGRAILNYNRALILNRNFLEAQANLRTTLKIVGNNTSPTIRHEVEAYADYFAAIISVGLWTVIFIFALRWLIRKPTPRFLWIVASIAITVATSGIVLSVWVGKGAKDPCRGIVVESAADLKYGPAVSARSIESLRIGDSIKLILQRGEWTFCKASTGTVGWILTQRVEPLIP